MAQLITGSCNCGRHVYTIPKPNEMNLCHCRKWAGAMYSAHLPVKTVDIQTESPQPRIYGQKSESGKILERAWCDECGCGIWITTPDTPDVKWLKAGLFNPGEIPNPTTEKYLKHLESWETPAKGTKRAVQDN